MGRSVGWQWTVGSVSTGACKGAGLAFAHFQLQIWVGGVALGFWKAPLGGQQEGLPSGGGNFSGGAECPEESRLESTYLGDGSTPGQGAADPRPWLPCPDPQDKRLINRPGVFEPWSCEGFVKALGPPGVAPVHWPLPITVGYSILGKTTRAVEARKENGAYQME